MWGFCLPPWVARAVEGRIGQLRQRQSLLGGRKGVMDVLSPFHRWESWDSVRLSTMVTQYSPTTQLSGRLKYVLRSVSTKACTECIKDKKKGVASEERINWKVRESKKWGSHEPSSPAGLAHAPGPAQEPTVTVWFSSSLLLGTSKFSFVRRKQWL